MKTNIKKLAAPVVGLAVLAAGIVSAAATDPIPNPLPNAVAGNVIKASDINDLATAVGILDERSDLGLQKDINTGNFSINSLDGETLSIDHSGSVTMRPYITRYGQGGGLMVNAKLNSQTSNPFNTDNSKFTINPGTYNTGASILHLDGNGKTFSFGLAGSSTGVDTPATFTKVFDYGSGALSTVSNATYGSYFQMFTTPTFETIENTPDQSIRLVRIVSTIDGTFNITKNYNNGGASDWKNLITSPGNSGYVGINNSYPKSQLHVDGAVQIANTTNACDADHAGAVKFDGTNFQGCDGTAWVQLNN